jgi:hypothetical protein
MSNVDQTAVWLVGGVEFSEPLAELGIELYPVMLAYNHAATRGY